MTRKQLEKQTVRELRDLCEARGVAKSGNKGALVERLAATMQPIEHEVASRTRDALDGVGSPEQTLHWLEQVRLGLVHEERMPGGDSTIPVQVPASLKARQDAAMQAEKLRVMLAERDRLFIPRDLVADALVGIGNLLRDRMQAIPSRLADQISTRSSVAEIRSQLTAAIDGVLVDLGDAAERELAELLGEHAG